MPRYRLDRDVPLPKRIRAKDQATQLSPADQHRINYLMRHGVPGEHSMGFPIGDQHHIVYANALSRYCNKVGGRRWARTRNMQNGEIRIWKMTEPPQPRDL